MADPEWLQQYDRDLAPLLESYRAQAAQKPQGIFANVDPVMLGLAQGFLSPTKTGGFGESIGLGLAGAQGPLESIRKRQMDAQNKILELQATRAKMAMEAPYLQARADYLASGGSRGAPLSPTERRRTLESDIADLENGDPETLGITEEQRLELLKQKRREKLQLDKLVGPEAKSSEGTKEKPAEAPPEKGVLQKTKEFLGIGGNETQKKTPPKDYPDARIGAGGHWYVIRDGKPYRVDE